MIESEIKVRVQDLETVRVRLESRGAELLHPRSFERNELFDRDRDLLGSGCVLRLREDGQGARVTFKGPPRYEGDVKVRQELETKVGDAEVLRSILQALGYARHMVYEKYREEWSLGDALICLDETPLGPFLEIEADQPREILEQIDIPHSGSETRSYVGLWIAAREKDPSLPADMVFGDDLGARRRERAQAE